MKQSHSLLTIVSVIPALFLTSSMASGAGLGDLLGLPSKPKTQPTASPAAATAPKVPPESPVEKLARQDVAKSVLVGAATGAVIGAVIGNNTGDGDAKKGAFYGGIAGGILGLGVGSIAAERRKAYGKESAYLESEIASANNVISLKEQQIATAENDLKLIEADIVRLEGEKQKNFGVTAEARELRKGVEKKIADYDETLRGYQESISYLNESLSESLTKKATTNAEREEVESLQTNLIVKRNDLSKQFAQLSTQREAAAKARERLLAME